ncbi:hypothetical protein FOA52_014183 [Chlamydomonas sp. UWO 241]|nr:hypothetical protein FOA52_014183 [Chlamydomonas sp. UWO 241]
MIEAAGTRDGFAPLTIEAAGTLAAGAAGTSTLSASRTSFEAFAIDELASDVAFLRAEVARRAPAVLRGSGSSAVSLFMWRLMDAFQAMSTSPVWTTYRAIGSGGGEKEIQGTGGVVATEFGCSDVPMKQSVYNSIVAAGEQVVHIPILIAPISFFVNIPASVLPTREIKLSACTIAHMFQGDTITTWDHPDIVATNPGIILPAVAIKPAYRSGSSGTNAIVSEYLAQVCTDWTLGSGKTLPATGATGTFSAVVTSVAASSAMTAFIADTEYSIGYADSANGAEAGLLEVSVLNRNGKWLTSALADLSAAAAELYASGNGWPSKPSSDFSSVSLLNQAGDATWPISAMPFMMLRSDLVGRAESGPLTVAFVKHMLSDDSQATLLKIGFAPLPEDVLEYARTKAVPLLNADPKYPAWYIESKSGTTYRGAGASVLSGAKDTYVHITSTSTSPAAAAASVTATAVVNASAGALNLSSLNIEGIAGIANMGKQIDDLTNQVNVLTSIAIGGLTFGITGLLIGIFIVVRVFVLTSTGSMPSVGKGSFSSMSGARPSSDGEEGTHAAAGAAAGPMGPRFSVMGNAYAASHHSSPQSHAMEQLKQVAFEFLGVYCRSQLLALLRAPLDDEHHALEVDFMELAQHALPLAEALLRSPMATFDMLDEVLCEAQNSGLEALMAEPDDDTHGSDGAHGSMGEGEPCTKEGARVRVASLPCELEPGSSMWQPPIARVGAPHIGRLLTLHGTLVKAGAVRMFECKRWYTCSRCRIRMSLTCSVDMGGAVTLPESCPRTDKPCTGTKFVPAEDGYKFFTGFQEVKLQERVQCLAMGALPASITVALMHEMAGAARPGDDMTVTGVVVPRWEGLKPGERASAQLVVVAHHVHVCSQRQDEVDVPPQLEAMFEDFWARQRDAPMRARDTIVGAVCPQIHGCFLVKLATLLTLAGGVARQQGGTRIRGDVHMLAIGDPGLGKSQIMKFAARVAVRSVVTSGRGSSGAGLTCTAIKDGASWVLEAGALVLADGGLCVVDEFDGVKECDRAMLHEAMEQQTIHVAKAGMVTTLPTRTSVLAATNPRSGWTPARPVDQATNISGPLLSRFDILLVLRDARNSEWDRKVASAVLDAHQANHPDATRKRQAEAARAAAAASAAARAAAGASTSGRAYGAGQFVGGAESAGGWTIDVLKRYLVWARRTFSPELSAGAELVLSAYYQALRRADDRSAPRTTVRMLESLVRVAQAHARLCARAVVSRDDALVSVLVSEASANCLMVAAPDSAMYSAFADDPDAEHAWIARRIYLALGLPWSDPGARLLAAPQPTQQAWQQQQQQASQEHQQASQEQQQQASQQKQKRQQTQQEQMQQKQQQAAMQQEQAQQQQQAPSQQQQQATVSAKSHTQASQQHQHQQPTPQHKPGQHGGTQPAFERTRGDDNDACAARDQGPAPTAVAPATKARHSGGDGGGGGMAQCTQGGGAKPSGGAAAPAAPRSRLRALALLEDDVEEL